MLKIRIWGAAALMICGWISGTNCAVGHELPPGTAHAGEHDAGATAPALGAAPFRLQAVQTSGPVAGNVLPQLQLPVLGGAGKPWTRTDVNNDPKDFQIAIVTDRAGGMRPGIFDDAVTKLNLLQPEFVISVGDLIQGYTKNEAELKQQWDEFEGLVAGLEMPFFYVPGNHDMSNPVQIAEWHRRFGPNYYHFVYGDVLFLCLDTEDAGNGKLSPEQVEYFRQALAENQDVRWTLVFMHRPIWIKDELHELSTKDKSDRAVLKESGWLAMEEMLHDRKYTVYAGHVHSYTKYERHDNKYFILATTGGGSGLRGAEVYGQCDHVAWITMTDEGPIMANLLLDGIYDENMRTKDVATVVRATIARAVQAEPAVTDPVPFSSATVRLRLANSAKVPMKLKLESPKGGAVKYAPATLTVTVPPKSVEFAELTADASSAEDSEQLENQLLRWTATYDLGTESPIQVEGETALLLDPKHVVERAPAGMAIDGIMTEWESLWSGEQHFRQTIGHRKAWLGTDDATVQFATAYDDDYVYVAARVTDDEIVPHAGGEEAMRTADHLRVYLAPVSSKELSVEADAATTTTPDEEKPGSSDPGRNVLAADARDSIIHVLATPTASGESSCTIILPKEQQVQAQCRTTSGVYELEMAVPVELLQEEGAQPWKYFRMNLRVNDMDLTGKPRAELWWKPEWNGADASPHSGLFVRE